MYIRAMYIHASLSHQIANIARGADDQNALIFQGWKLHLGVHLEALAQVVNPQDREQYQHSPVCLHRLWMLAIARAHTQIPAGLRPRPTFHLSPPPAIDKCCSACPLFRAYNNTLTFMSTLLQAVHPSVVVTLLLVKCRTVSSRRPFVPVPPRVTWKRRRCFIYICCGYSNYVVYQ